MCLFKDNCCCSKNNINFDIFSDVCHAFFDNQLILWKYFFLVNKKQIDNTTINHNNNTTDSDLDSCDDLGSKYVDLGTFLERLSCADIEDNDVNTTKNNASCANDSLCVKIVAGDKCVFNFVVWLKYNDTNVSFIIENVVKSPTIDNKHKNNNDKASNNQDGTSGTCDICCTNCGIGISYETYDNKICDKCSESLSLTLYFSCNDTDKTK
jgi:hypothetical protein